jgi:rhodanese-related sulfurtransferase
MYLAPNPTTEFHPSRLPGHAPLAVDAGTLQTWIVDEAILLVDVREPQEFERERIAGAFLVPMSRFDAATFPRIPGLRTVLVSEQDGRSLALAERLADEGFVGVYALAGGLAAWRAAGFELDE